MRKITITAAVLFFAIASLIIPSSASAHHGYSYRYYTVDYVSVADRTGPFPVAQSTTTWNNGLNTVDPNYRWWDCLSANGCIMIWENPNLGTSYGQALPQYLSNGQYRGSNIQLNPNAAVTAQQRLKTVCHELGHGLGLNDHPAVNFYGSCMVQGQSPPVVTYPDWHDFEVVNNMN